MKVNFFDIKQEIINFSKIIGIDLIGFAKAQPFFKEYDFLLERKRNGLISPFEEKDLEKRCFPEKIMNGVRTIIVFAVSYLNYYNSSLLFTENNIDGDNKRGIISKYACIVDYHLVLKGKLSKIALFIKNNFNANAMVFVDTGSLLERAAAERAGIGYIGQNTCLFTKEFGSYVFLGEILTDLELPEDEQAESLCTGCGRCIKACPTGALYEPFKIDPFKCLSYITQSKNVITDKEIIHAFGNRLFGCDTCQDVCPNNRKENLIIKNHGDFLLDNNIPLDPLYILNIKNKEFEGYFGKTPIAWRGKNVLRRNALIVMANTGQLKEVNKEILLDLSELVRKQAEVLFK